MGRNSESIVLRARWLLLLVQSCSLLLNGSGFSAQVTSLHSLHYEQHIFYFFKFI